MSNPHPEYQDVKLETVDRAIRDWFDKTVDAHVMTASKERKKVPVIFASGERFVTARERKGIRDKNGVLILPIISLRRTGIAPDGTMQSLGIDTGILQIAKKISGKTNNLQNLEMLKQPSQRLPYSPLVYEVTTIPFPSRSILNYELTVQAQYTTQMNAIWEKIFYTQNLQNSFVAPLDNDNYDPPEGDPLGKRTGLKQSYVVGFFDSDSADIGNVDEFTDVERIVMYSTSFYVPATLQLDPEGERPSLRTEKTAFGLRFGDETTSIVDSPADLEKIFGPLY